MSFSQLLCVNLSISCSFYSTGHVIFSDKSRKALSSIIPPFPGHWQFPKFMSWLQEGKVQRWFIPRCVRYYPPSARLYSDRGSLPAPLHNTSPLHEKILHRLTYRRLQAKTDESQTTSGFPTPVQVLKYEVVLSEKRVSEEDSGMRSDPEHALDAPSEDELEVSRVVDRPALSVQSEEAFTNLENNADESPTVDETVSSCEMTGNDPEDVSNDVSSVDTSDPQAGLVLNVIGEPSFQKLLELDILLSLPDR